MTVHSMAVSWNPSVVRAIIDLFSGTMLETTPLGLSVNWTTSGVNAQ